MNVDKLKKFYLVKSDTDLGSRLDLSKGTISKWRKFGIPEHVQAVFEVQTGFMLKANLSKYASFKATDADLKIYANKINNKSIETN